MADTELYDQLGGDYDRMVNWPARLSAELPFLLRVLRGAGARRVIDVACGSGRHAIALAQAGLDVVGVDPSRELLRAADASAREAGLQVRFVEAGLGQLRGLALRAVDAVLCLGNSLPHLLSAREVRAAFEDMSAVLRPGGVVITQSRNYDRLREPVHMAQPLERHVEGDRQWLFARFSESTGVGDDGVLRLLFHVVTIRQAGDAWSYSVSTAHHRPVLSPELGGALSGAGFSTIELLGNMQEGPFDPDASSDLVAVARRAPAE